MTTTRPEPLPRDARLLLTARVVDRLGGFTLAFLPALLVTSYGASLRTAGLVAAAYGVATIPSRLAGGWLADRLGRRATIVVGLLGCAAAQLGLVVAPGLAWAAVAAVVLGLFFEVYEPPSQALLADVVPEPQRARAYAALGAAISGAAVVAGLLAAVLAHAGLRWLFVADAVTCLACALLVVLTLHDRAPEASRRARNAPSRSPWRDPRLRAMLGAGTVFAVTYLALVGGLPLALRHDGIGASWAGVLLAVSAGTVIAAQRVRERLPGLGPFGRLRTGYLLVALGLALAAVVAVVAPSGPAYVVPVVVLSVGDLVVLGEPMAVVAGLAEPSDRGRYLAVYGLCWGVAATLAPVVATGLVAAGGPVLLWGALAAVLALLGLAQPRLGAVVNARLPASTIEA